MSFGQATTKELNKVRASHNRYLATYKLLTGSYAGATTFSDFYIYWTYTAKYADPRACAAAGYR